MSDWRFLTNHARVLLFIRQNPDARLRDIASALGITDRRAYGIVVDLADAGYVIKEREGRRNRYHIQPHLSARETIAPERTIGEILDLLGRQQGGVDTKSVGKELDIGGLPGPAIQIDDLPHRKVGPEY